ncbi:MAG: galactose mutarotase [Lachnospiraceae bacterium]|nr:galactose mutarotase [Lachnospiraceae bacterium]
MIDVIKRYEDGVDLIRMTTASIDMTVSNLGGHILSLLYKDSLGIWETVVLGYEEVHDCREDGACLCAICGRVANRIGDGKFELNGKSYQLATNSGPHHLHGGEHGFDEKVFDYEIIHGDLTVSEDCAKSKDHSTPGDCSAGEKLIFTYRSADGEEGYPGNLDTTITYHLEDNRLFIDFEYESDQDTIVNLTNHMYFNLSGNQPETSAFKNKIYGHELLIDADEMTLVDETGLAYGPKMKVAGTPFDFNDFHVIGERIDADHEQIKNASGYDQAFMLNRSIKVGQSLEGASPQAVLMDPESGRCVNIFTSYPAIQIYTSNFLSGGVNGHHGKPYEDRDGIAIETQYMSNSIQIEDEPKVILKSGEHRHEQTVFEFM